MQLKDNARVRESNPTEEILSKGLIDRAIEECLKAGDSEGMIEVIRIYLKALNT